MGCHFLLQGIFPIQGSNPCLLHWQADSLLLIISYNHSVLWDAQNYWPYSSCNWKSVVFLPTSSCFPHPSAPAATLPLYFYEFLFLRFYIWVILCSICCFLSFFLFKKYLIIWLDCLGCGTWTLSCDIWDLVPWPGIKLQPPVLGAQSFSHWTTREVPLWFSVWCLSLSTMPSRFIHVVTNGGVVFWPYQVACGILIHRQGIEPKSSTVKA